MKYFIGESTILTLSFNTCNTAQDIDDTLLIISDTLPGKLKWMKGVSLFALQCQINLSAHHCSKNRLQ